MATPSNLKTGTVVGQFVTSVTDGPDADALPENVPAKGTVTFTASTGVVLSYADNPNPVAVLKAPIVCPLDSEGYLCSPGTTNRGVNLLATDDPDLNPVGWVWKVSYQLSDQNNKPLYTINDAPIEVPAGETIDLIKATPVASSNGVFITKGLKGDKGDTGIQGIKGDTGNGLGVDVTWFGAKGDSVTDDTAAIQAAINSLPAAGGSVFFPAGTYVISDAIQARNALKIFGEGNSSSVIYQTMPNKHGIAGTDILSFSIEDIRVVGAGSGAGIGIMFERYNNDATNYIHAKNVYVRTFGKDGIYVSNGIVSRFDTVISESNGGNGFNLVGLNGVIGTSTSLNNCFANANALSGYRMDTMGYMNFNACAADNNAIGYEMLNAIGLTFNGCGAEGSTTAAFKIDAGYGNTISGGWMYKNKAIGVLITNNSIGATITGLSETSPEATATACVQVDAGSKATLLNIHNDKPNVLAAGTTQIINDVSGASSFNGSMDIQGALTLNGFNVSTQRGSRWYLSGGTTNDYTDVTGMIEGDIFLYGNSRDMFRYNGSSWDYYGVLAA